MIPGKAKAPVSKTSFLENIAHSSSAKNKMCTAAKGNCSNDEKLSK